MFDRTCRTYHAAYPDMMECVSTDELPDHAGSKSTAGHPFDASDLRGAAADYLHEHILAVEGGWLAR